MTKSHVSMEQHVCLVCGHTYDTGSILLDKQLRERFERNTVTGNGLCPEHQKLHDDGYLALVAIDESKSQLSNNTTTPNTAYRTGDIAHVRRTVARDIFNVPVPDEEPLMFCSPEVINHLKAIA
jgi:hypothetical protein